jgi:RNA polymerase sigma factor (sigma-70 family)
MGGCLPHITNLTDAHNTGDKDRSALHRELEALFLEHRQALQNYLRKWIKSPEDAQEILQEVWLRVMKHGNCDQLSSPAARSFLYAIASNLVRDRHRTQVARRYDQHESLENDSEISCNQSTPDDYAAYQQTRDRFLDALTTLDSKYRDAFVMHRFMDKKQEEIAQTLGVSIRTVERYIEIALKHCRHYLQDHLS